MKQKIDSKWYHDDIQMKKICPLTFSRIDGPFSCCSDQCIWYSGYTHDHDTPKCVVPKIWESIERFKQDLGNDGVKIKK